MFKFKLFEKHYQGWSDTEHLPILSDLQIFKYMDLWKFLSLLETKSIYFAKQSSFTDPHEGTINKNLKLFFQSVDSVYVDDISEKMKGVRETNKISCWKIGDKHKDAMFQIYAAKYGIAIESRLEQLESSIDYEDEIYAGKIFYSNDCRNPFGLLPPEEDRYLIPSFWKSHDFAYEDELRFLIDGRRTNVNDAATVKLKDFDFINCLHLSPYLSNWQMDIVESIKNKFNLNVKIIRPDWTPNFEPYRKH